MEDTNPPPAFPEGFLSLDQTATENVSWPFGDYELLRNQDLERRRNVRHSIVLQGKRNGTNKLYAIKICGEDGNSKRFEREIEITRKQEDSGIITIVEDGLLENRPVRYYVTPWIEGRGLADYLDDRAVSQTDHLKAVLELCRIVAKLHSNDVVHRDIKPSNAILKDSQPEALVLLDFGLAIPCADKMSRANKIEVSDSIDVTGTEEGVIGTVGFIPHWAFERVYRQRENKHEYLRQWDVFSLGVVLFIALTGIWPRKERDPNFEPHRAAELLRQNSGFHPCDPIVVKCLATYPGSAGAYDDARELYAELKLRLQDSILGDEPPQSDLKLLRHGKRNQSKKEQPIKFPVFSSMPVYNPLGKSKSTPLTSPNPWAGVVVVMLIIAIFGVVINELDTGSKSVGNDDWSLASPSETNIINHSAAPARGRNSIPSGEITQTFQTRLIGHPESKRVRIGQTIDLAVRIAGAEPTTIQWLRDNYPIRNGTNAIVRFLATGRSDSGNYMARVTGADGTTLTSRPANIQVGAPPSVSAQYPQKSIVPVVWGSGPVFHVFPKGDKPMASQWMRNGAPINKATNTWLSLPAVDVAASGRYSVVLSNPWGSVTSIWNMRVDGSPVIRSGPSNLTIAKPGDVSFRVAALGEPPLRFLWICNGVPQSWVTGKLGEQSNQIQEWKLRVNGSAFYQLIVSNAYGVANSDIALVSVPNAELGFRSAVSPIFPREGQYVTNTIVITNTGTRTLQNLEVAYNIAKGLRHQTGKPKLIFDAGDLSSREAKQSSVILICPKAGVYTNSVVALTSDGLEFKMQQIISVFALPVTSRTPKFGKPFQFFLSKGAMLEMMPINSGRFRMGSESGLLGLGAEQGRRNDEKMHAVEISEPFWLSNCEVTQGQWFSVMGYNPSHFVARGHRAPVENVGWHDAVQFCDRLTEYARLAGTLPEGYEYTLPTEAQWEYACRSGASTAYSFGKHLPYSSANFDELFRMNSTNSTIPVASFRPNYWGLYDMHGNVFEWCFDYYGEYSIGFSRYADPAGPSIGIKRVIRGGSYLTSRAAGRSASRSAAYPLRRSSEIGFRVCLSHAFKPVKFR